MRHLDLFSGIGGFALAAKWIGGIETTQFVEIDPYCQKVLAKNFPGVPIHNDIRTFTANAGDYDLITAGFPCQPHSVAGKREASKDDRDLWPELYRVIREVRPRWIVLENVPGLLSSESGRFFCGVLRDLATARFDAEWAVVSCLDMGGSHKRERIWIVAYPTQRSHPPGGFNPPNQWINPYANSEGLSSWVSQARDAAIEHQKLSFLKRFHGGRNREFTSQPTVHRGDDGIPKRVDRIRALGNSIVPQVAMIPLKRVLYLESLL